MRLASTFTAREGNDFCLTPEELHGVERVGWGLLGIVLGAFVVWAPSTGGRVAPAAVLAVEVDVA